MEIDSLSSVAKEIARGLSALKTAACLDSHEAAFPFVERIACLLDSHSEPMDQQAQHFASIGSTSETISMGSTFYSSAHEAVFREAQLFMEVLWYHLDIEGYAAICSNHSDSDFRREIMRIKVINNGTDLDARKVVDRWECAKEAIQSYLTDEWKQEFAAIKARLSRETAAFHSQQGEKRNRPAAERAEQENWTVDKANKRALELAAEDFAFLNKGYRDWGDKIGCKGSLVRKTALWKFVMKARNGEASQRGESHKTVSLTPAMLAKYGEEDEELQALINEQHADYEPSPLDPSGKSPVAWRD